MKWRFFLGEAVNSIRGNAATTLAAVVTVLIVTFLLGVTVTVGKWVYDYTNGVRNDITVKAYVSTSDYGSNDSQTVIKRGNLLNEIESALIAPGHFAEVDDGIIQDDGKVLVTGRWAPGGSRLRPGAVPTMC